ncbi:helix-turn-helix transcriptional regulator [Nocardia spumae]|uniref:helix-turn-helix transcriptional regulator n=1 Tax=Nocardia spumae TaxID=2887190 RepID=UPI001D134661|nr:AraC family transcriptional regulator [Nocardia spumae]
MSASAVEQVRIRRPPDAGRILLMAGRTTGYGIEPRGEYVFGVVAGEAMVARRGRERRTVAPGRVVAWDPSHAHSGTSVTHRPWSCRLMIVELADLAHLGGEQDVLADVAFPDPVLDDPRLAAEFVRLHHVLEKPATRLERDERLTVWLHTVIGRHSAKRGSPSTTRMRDDGPFRLACDYLGDNSPRNIGLDELAGAAGIDKFRLIRVFRERTGTTPHAVQIAHRIRLARRLLENGYPLADTATATGFADQSHLHRHFRASTGMTPGRYRDRLTAERRAAGSPKPVGRPPLSGTTGHRADRTA